jgi:methylated-DNA-[protein]-cysteine S-methyltransferase
MYYTYVDSPIGPMFLAGDSNGISRISFTVGHQVRQPQPGWIEDAAPLDYAIAQLEGYFAGERQVFDLPLIMEGTEFQKRVWKVVLGIPFGETWSYGQVAEALGSPGASRAVGGANHANHLPLVVPCHRVIGADRSLTGFGGGLETKRWLLDFEGALPESDQRQGRLF